LLYVLLLLSDTASREMRKDENADIASDDPMDTSVEPMDTSVEPMDPYCFGVFHTSHW